jgi:DNA polymerase-1
VGQLKSTYIDGYIDKYQFCYRAHHPRPHASRTETGRFASRNPNLQNCHARINDPVGVRNFIAAPEGSLIVSLDFSR